MARIRTIKPEFFTSEDIVKISPLARLLYAATWCEADKEGRLEWKPMTFKLRYFPGDTCDIEAMCKELIDAGLVVLYSKGLAFIPMFKKHQHINPRESASQLPEPDATSTRADASPRVNSRIDPHVGREGKGREGKVVVDAPEAPKTGSRLPDDWKLPDDWAVWAKENRPDCDPLVTAESFRDYWHAMAGKDGRKADWLATWRNWVRNQRVPAKAAPLSTNDRPAWLTGTGFTNVWEANNAGCYATNAAKFRGLHA